MSEALTARIIGSKGRMGREHVAAYKEAGIKLVKGKADIVSIASPDNTHGEYVIEALKQGSHVFCEKPLCTKSSELLEIKTRAGDRRIGVNYPLRHQQIFTDIAKSIGAYGEIYRVEASYNWGRTNKLNETWRKDGKYSLVLGGMIHMIDLVSAMLNLDIEPISVIGCNKSAPGFDGPDTIVANCRLENGGLCTLTVDGGTGVSRHNHRLTVHGTKRGRTIVNHEPTDKQAAIRDFIKSIGSGEKDIYAMGVALKIENALWA